MQVLKPGQTVTLQEGDVKDGVPPLEGRITSVTIYDDNSHQYNVRWWADGEPCSDTFSLMELQEPVDAKYLTVEPSD